MDYRPLGKTGIEVSSLSFGASALGSVFRDIDEPDCIEAVHTALENGTNYFDVAPAYGNTRAESVLGKALKGIPRDHYRLSTKAGKYGPSIPNGPCDFDYTYERISKEIDLSMERLGVDYLDIVHLHDFEYENGVHIESAFDEGIPALQTLKSQGRIGAIGAGIYPIDLWQRVVSEAPVEVILLHNHYCLNDTRALELLPICQEKGIGIINASPFASSLLTGGPVADWHPSTPADRVVFKAAADFCAQQGVSIAKLAFQFASQNSDFPTTLFSTASNESLLRNLKWHQEPYDSDLLNETLQFLEPVRNKQWNYDLGIV